MRSIEPAAAAAAPAGISPTSSEPITSAPCASAAAGPREGGAALGPCVHDRRQAEAADALAERERRTPRALQVLRPDRHQWDDVGRADPRVRPFVAAQVDPLARDPDARHERLDETVLRADDREDAAIVV